METHLGYPVPAQSQGDGVAALQVPWAQPLCLLQLQQWLRAAGWPCSATPSSPTTAASPVLLLSAVSSALLGHLF